MFRTLPPVGDPIKVKKECLDSTALSGIFPGWFAHYYGSGAMALASVLKTVLALKGPNGWEVLLPAYSCPELISAILFAGGAPILVDMEKDRPWLSLEDLDHKITPNTAAIIAVDLFGIPERIKQIRNVIGIRDITLIEDSAQYMPRNPGPDSWSGDYVVLSFGRGKPVSLLGGGAILTRVGVLLRGSKGQNEEVKSATLIQRFRARLKCHLYNVLIKPSFYWIPASLPFLNLGTTRFTNLVSIDPIDPGHICLLSTNLRQYSSVMSNKAQELHDLMKEINLGGVVDLADITSVDLNNLLRYPILIQNPDVRKELLNRANKLGLGVTTLYGTNLTGVEGIGHEISSQKDLPNSAAFAAELLTLPVHSAMSGADIKALSNLLRTLWR